MRNLLKTNTDSEMIAQEYSVVYYSVESKKVEIKKSKEQPSYPFLQCWYNITDTSSTTPLMAYTDNVSRVFLNGEELSLEKYETSGETSGYGYQFNVNGMIKLDIELIDNTSLNVHFYRDTHMFYEDVWDNIESLVNVIIPNSVTSINTYAFYNCRNLTSVTISNSVTSIGCSAFANCKALTSITIPNSVTSIGSSAFANCDNLLDEDRIIYGGKWVIWHKDNLISATIKDGIVGIGGGAFCGCTGLTSVTIPNSVTSIGNGAFDSCI